MVTLLEVLARLQLRLRGDARAAALVKLAPPTTRNLQYRRGVSMAYGVPVAEARVMYP